MITLLALLQRSGRGDDSGWPYLFALCADVFAGLGGLFLVGRLEVQSFFAGIAVILVLATVAALTMPGAAAEEDSDGEGLTAEDKDLLALKEARISRLQMEAHGARESQKRARRSVEHLMQENDRLRREIRNLSVRLKKLQMEAGLSEESSAFPNEDLIRWLLEENQQLKNRLNRGEGAEAAGEDAETSAGRSEAADKDSRSGQEEAARARARRQKAAFARARRPAWMTILPYAPGDTLEDVKFAYRAMAKSAHPDSASPDPERMKRLNEAWEQACLWFKQRRKM